MKRSGRDPKLLLLFALGLMLFAAAEEVPYGVDHRKMPVGNDFREITMDHFGPWTRVRYVAPKPDMDGQAEYQMGTDRVLMLFGKCSSLDELNQVFNTVCSEATNGGTVKPDVMVKGKDPSYILMKTAGGGDPFFGWTRGLYYFSVEDMSKGKNRLDEFMKLLPF